MDITLLFIDFILAPFISFLTEKVKNYFPQVTSKQIVLCMAMLLGITFWVASIFFPEITSDQAIAHAGMVSALSMNFYNFFMKNTTEQE